MTQDKKDFIEAMLTWFRSPQVGNDEEIDREFLSDAYDSIAYPHWISVEDELPEDGIRVVAANKAGAQDIRFRYHGKWYSNFGNEYTDVTSWYPLPETPVLSNSSNTGKNHLIDANNMIDHFADISKMVEKGGKE